jgi:predicted phosphoribosyltransferase/dienelactone hydrolase
MRRPFRDRQEAGHALAALLLDYAGRDDVIVLGLPRGGVPVAFEVARALGAPLDVFLVRKLGAPGHEELAMGAIASGGVVVMNDEVVRAMNVKADDILDAIAGERRELARREQVYRDGRPPADVRGKTVILIDDGLATGSTMRAAVTALRRQGPARIVVAVPIGASSTCAELHKVADECICAFTPEPFRAVGLWYEDFSQTEDDEVAELLARARAVAVSEAGHSPSWDPVELDPIPSATVSPPGGRPMNDPRPPDLDEEEVAIPAGRRIVRGTLSRPRGAAAVVVFAHGSGSGRFSPRNQSVARVLQESGLATLLLDLLEEDEARDRSMVFDIERLADRLAAAADWLRARPETAGLRLGYFGASTGAGAALLAAGRDPDSVGAVVSRGGRPDLARDALPRVTAPTLMIVGSNDEIVLELNREAFDQLSGIRQLDIVAGAGHLFEEPGTLEEVSRLAREWFLHYLTPDAAR